MHQTVGILTFHFASNYGAVLQALGTCKAVRSLGYDPKLISFYPKGLEHARNPIGLRSGRIFSTLSRRFRFDYFRKKHLPSSPHFNSLEMIASYGNQCRAMIVGSDQVWNMHLVQPFEPAYFLGMNLPASCRRVSYAACFGRSDQPPELLDAASQMLRRFDVVSVRNKSSAETFERLAGYAPQIVVDPTLLADFSDVTAPPLIKKPYILVFNLMVEFRDQLTKLMTIAQSALKMETVSISQMWDLPGADRYIKSAGPAEFLSLIKNASLVVTDSFHGTIFTIKSRRPLISYSDGWRSMRLREFLTDCGMQDRLITSTNEPHVKQLLNSETDYDPVHNAIEQSRMVSMNFLKNALAEQPK